MLVRAPGRSRPAGTDGSVRCVLPPAIHHAKRHASPALRWHSENRLDNSDTPPAATETARPDNHERGGSAGVSRRRLRVTMRQLLEHLPHRCPQLVKTGAVRTRHGAKHDIHGAQGRQQFGSCQVAQSPLHRVAVHRRVSEPGHDDPDARVMQRGSEVSHLELRGANSLPLNTNSLDLPFASQPRRARKPQAIRRRRTSTGASR